MTDPFMIDEPERLPPPVNYEAEQALLAAILDTNHAYDRVADFLRPEHFADAAHGRIFEAAGKLIERGQQASAITLKVYFDRDDDLAQEACCSRTTGSPTGLRLLPSTSSQLSQKFLA